MLKIIGRTSSSNVQKVLWACAELGVKYEREDAGREFGVVDTPEYARLNPNRRVPTIVEDGFVLWESNSIVRYLAAKQGGGLYPTDLRVRADAERWMDWQLSALGPAFAGIFHGLVRTEPDKRNWDSINKSRDATEKHLAMLDDCLSRKKYVAGDAFTVGDIPVGIYAYRWYAFEGVERKELKNLKRWYELLCQRPGYRDFVMVGM
jgi:glutathione S-transferase